MKAHTIILYLVTVIAVFTGSIGIILMGLQLWNNVPLWLILVFSVMTIAGFAGTIMTSKALAIQNSK